MIRDVMATGADVYVTGDIDYHTAIDTMADGLAIVDAGHYGTEYIFAEAMERELNEAFPDLKTTCASVKKSIYCFYKYKPVEVECYGTDDDKSDHKRRNKGIPQDDPIFRDCKGIMREKQSIR